MLAEDFGIRGGKNRKELVIDDMLQHKNKYIRNRDDKISKYLKDNSKLQTGGMTSSTMPGLDNQQVIAITKAVKKHFEKKSLNPNFKILYNGQWRDEGRKEFPWEKLAYKVGGKAKKEAEKKNT